MKVSNIIKFLYPQKAIKKTQEKISLLGINDKTNINTYLGLKFIILALVFFISLFYMRYGYLLAPFITVGCYFLYDYLTLDIKIKKRVNILEKEAIFFFEILVLSLQTENNLKMCLENTCDAIDSEISLEFKEVLKEVKIGKSMTEALNDAKKRIPSKNVNNILLNLTESYTYGTSITDTLENQIEYLTDKRILDIKGKINKIPTQISIISVLFFIPLIMLLILGPIILEYFIKL